MTVTEKLAVELNVYLFVALLPIGYAVGVMVDAADWVRLKVMG